MIQNLIASWHFTMQVAGKPETRKRVYVEGYNFHMGEVMHQQMWQWYADEAELDDAFPCDVELVSIEWPHTRAPKPVVATYWNGFSAFSELELYGATEEDPMHRTYMIQNDLECSDRIGSIHEIIEFAADLRKPPKLWNDLKSNIEWHWGL